MVGQISSILPPQIQRVIAPSAEWFGKQVQEFIFTTAPKGVAEMALRTQSVVIVIFIAIVAVVGRQWLLSLPPAEEIKAAYDDINEKWEAVLKNVGEAKESRESRESDLSNAIKNFKNKYMWLKYYPAYAGYSTCFTEVESLDKIFTTLLELGSSIVVPDFKIGKDGVVPVPSDGNCLFHAVVNGLVLLNAQNIKIDEESYDHEKLRKAVIEWEKLHVWDDPVLCGYIKDAIEGFVFVRERQIAEERQTLEGLRTDGSDVDAALEALTTEESLLELLKDRDQHARYQAYFSLLEKPGFFASTAEIYALSRLYPEVAFHTHRDVDGRRIEGFDPSFNNTAESKFSITVINVNSNHFNLFVPKAKT